MDLFEALGVIGMNRGLVRTLGDPESVREVVKMLYWHQAKVVHTDGTKPDPEKFARLTEAHNLLKADGALKSLLSQVKLLNKHEIELINELNRLNALKMQTTTLNDRIAKFLVDIVVPSNAPPKNLEIVLHDQVNINLKNKLAPKGARSTKNTHRYIRTVSMGLDRLLSDQNSSARKYVVGSLPKTFVLANDTQNEEATNRLLGLERPVYGQRSGLLRPNDFAQIVHVLNREISKDCWLVTFFEEPTSKPSLQGLAERWGNMFFKLEGIVQEIKIQ